MDILFDLFGAQNKNILIYLNHGELEVKVIKQLRNCTWPWGPTKCTRCISWFQCTGRSKAEAQSVWSSYGRQRKLCGPHQSNTKAATCRVQGLMGSLLDAPRQGPAHLTRSSRPLINREALSSSLKPRTRQQRAHNNTQVLVPNGLLKVGSASSIL
jgi:hypothetical protein